MRVLCASPWIPREWIEAHGFRMRGVWDALGHSESVLPRGVCGFAQRVADLARAHLSDPIIISTACDPLRRTADAIGGFRERTFLFNLPATWQTDVASRIYLSEIQRLGRWLVGLGGDAPQPEALADMMNVYSDRRSELHRMIRTWSVRQCAQALRRFFADGTVLSDVASGAPDTRGVPLALVGGPFTGSLSTLLEAVEELGGEIVVNGTEPGHRCLVPPLTKPPHRASALADLAQHYFSHIIDVFQRPNTRLYRWLTDRLSATGGRGIIIATQVGCDLWRAEAAGFREAFQLPVLLLESHHQAAGDQRDVGRLAAFVDSLR